MWRVVLFGAAWIASLVMLALGVGLLQRPRADTAVRNAIIAPPAPPPRVGSRYPGWTVTRAYSAHHVMVVEVDTEGPVDAMSIARQVVEPLQGRYDEALIYVREPGQGTGELPARRIQWTPRQGYIESIYSLER